MFCPRCSSNQSDEIKFCTSCGANLQTVREALEQPEGGEKFDWSDTWVAEMFMSGKAQEMRKRELERRMGITPEMKRYQEIKAGVIVSSVGVALAIFLFIFMQGIAGNVEPRAAEIITRLWIVGVIPFMVGLALIVNGLVVSKKIVELEARNEQRPKPLEEGAAPRGLRAANTNEFIPANMGSVTEQTTRHLSNTGQKVDR
ncbi:MAG TPA: zinc ribbon domain-containing protein [Pyrinomonadaceae bacterium]|nr:zinc ribbon domain-containing protein [Pyrinomonadaceae bacterium]